MIKPYDMKKFIALIFFSIITLNSFGTSIVILNLGDAIIIGADSKITYVNNGKIVKSQTILKIFHYKNYYFANAGVFYTQVKSIGLYSCKAKNLNSIVKRYIDIMTKVLPLYLKVLKETDEATYLQKKGNFVEIAFCGIENGKAVGKAVEFTVENTSSGNIIVKPLITEIPYEIPIFLGDKQAIIQNFGKIVALSKNDKTPYDIVNRCISFEIKDRPQAVGLPIKIVELSQKNGVRWVQ